jgi:uncharacterized protein YbjT (DUF2867 family)
MRPSAHLAQGTFDDFDLIVADNFVRAAEKCGVKQILYLGGLKPDNSEELSHHLRSRAEIEEVFLQSAIPATVLRAALVLGGEGSSFHIMTRLVQRLPVMMCPVWAQTLSQPVALKDVIKCLVYCIANPETFQKVYDIGGPEKITYIEMMMKTAELLGLSRHALPLPVLTRQLSTMWVCLVTGAPGALVRPLVSSLSSPLIVNPARTLHIPNYQFANIDEALKEALAHYDPRQKPLAFQGSPSASYVVRSVQRLPLPPGKTAEDVARAYMDFLSKIRPGFLKVEVKGSWIYFAWRVPYLRLLILEYAPDRSWSHRQLFYVRGGLLAKKTKRGRLEFREVLGGTAVIAAIHDFEPRLPWYIYRWTQALVHLWVMRRFGQYLKKVEVHKASV